MVEVHTHVAAEPDASVPAGVYRVVGEDAADATVTLLRVGDAGGTREVTGEVHRVPAAALDTSFEPAPNPDSGLSLRGLLRSLRTQLLFPYYWLRSRVG